MNGRQPPTLEGSSRYTGCVKAMDLLPGVDSLPVQGCSLVTVQSVRHVPAAEAPAARVRLELSGREEAEPSDEPQSVFVTFPEEAAGPGRARFVGVGDASAQLGANPLSAWHAESHNTFVHVVLPDEVRRKSRLRRANSDPSIVTGAREEEEIVASADSCSCSMSSSSFSVGGSSRDNVVIGSCDRDSGWAWSSTLGWQQAPLEQTARAGRRRLPTAAEEDREAEERESLRSRLKQTALLREDEQKVREDLVRRLALVQEQELALGVDVPSPEHHAVLERLAATQEAIRTLPQREVIEHTKVKAHALQVAAERTRAEVDAARAQIARERELCAETKKVHEKSIQALRANIEQEIALTNQLRLECTNRALWENFLYAPKQLQVTEHVEVADQGKIAPPEQAETSGLSSHCALPANKLASFIGDTTWSTGGQACCVLSPQHDSNAVMPRCANAVMLLQRADSAHEDDAARDLEDEIVTSSLVLLRGFLSHAVVADVRRFLGKFATALCDKDPIKMIYLHMGRPSGDALVRFVSPEAANEAVFDLHGCMMDPSDRHGEHGCCIEAFLHSDWPSLFPCKNGYGGVASQIFGSPPLPLDPALEVEALMVDPVEVVHEIRWYMQQRLTVKLSMLGMVLSPAMRLHLQWTCGLKRFLFGFPNEFVISGVSGIENVTYVHSTQTPAHAC